jgi:peptide deformylase
MTIHRIRQLGDPILRTQCERVSNTGSPAARIVADDLRETLAGLKAKSGSGRGLAAPQIAAPIRVVHVEIERPWLLFNPEIVDVGTDDFLLWDDCFSFPDLMVQVQRAYHIRVRYTDEQGDEQEVEAEGPLAELLQHEIDHLDGVLAVDRAAGLDPFCLRAEWAKRHGEPGRYGEPFSRDESDAPNVGVPRYRTPRDSLQGILKPSGV